LERAIENQQKMDEILELVNDSNISSIKSVVSGIVRVINDPLSTARDLKDIIHVDPPLAAKLFEDYLFFIYRGSLLPNK